MPLLYGKPIVWRKIAIFHTLSVLMALRALVPNSGKNELAGMKNKLVIGVCGFAVALACLLAGSCKKHKYYYIDADIKQAFTTLKKGSYWIYEDSVTGKIDSFAIYADAGSSLQDGGSGYTEETGGLAMTEYGYTSIGKDTVNWTILCYGYDSHINISCERPGKAQDGASFALNAPGITIPKQVQVSILPRLTLYGNVFENVTLNVPSDSSLTNKAYICVNYDPGMLVIKQTHPYFNRTLKLIRWHIIR